MRNASYINGKPSTKISIKDRSVAYGDGIFETMRVVYDDSKSKAYIPLFEEHKTRFEQGIISLKLGSVSVLLNNFSEDVSLALTSLMNSAICKVILTRGQGGQGYIPLDKPANQMIVQLLDQPSYPAEFAQNGVSVKTCQIRLPTQPALAGIKHLNRLEQVIASQELGDEQEGLMFDQNNHLIEGIKSNVLLFEGRKIITPQLDSCGVKGTLRDYLISNSDSLGIAIEEGVIDQNRINKSDGLAMINSVFGLWPVKDIDGSPLPIAPHCKTIQAYIQQQLGY